MVRPLLALLLLHAGIAGAESLHLAPPGTVVRGSFDLAGKTIPLPAGDFVLAAAAVEEKRWTQGDMSKATPSLARLLVVQIQPPRLRAAVYAEAVMAPPTYRFEWLGDACRREDVLFRSDLIGSNGGPQNCLLVTHLVGNFGARAQGLWKDAGTWLAGQNVQLPVPLLIVASVTRTQGWQLVKASYAFNPRMYACNAPRAKTWADSPWHRSHVGDDPERVRFVQSVTAWGKVAQQHLDGLVAGRSPATPAPPAIYSCAAGPA